MPPILVGIDEAGRGALAGPVVAGAVLFPENLDHKQHQEIISQITDSKLMGAKQRERCFVWIVTNCIYGVGISSSQTIDEIGIKPANHEAMKKALFQITKKQSVELVQIDGNDKFKFSVPSEDIVGGDGKILEISAASIIAKVTRDQLMADMDIKYPGFGFLENKGYGTKKHREELEYLNYCAEHRKSYEPLKTRLNQHRLPL